MTTNPIEWLQQKSKMIQNSGKNVGNSNSPTPLVGVQISATNLENCSALSRTVEHICTL